MGQSVGDALIGKLTPPEGKPVEVMLPLHFPNFDKMRGGAVFIAVTGQTAEAFGPGKGPAKSEKRYFTGLQVTYDPGVWVVYAGFVMMIAGCFITFFMAHRQVCVTITPESGGCRVTVTATTNKNKAVLQRQVDETARQLENAIDAG